MLPALPDALLTELFRQMWLVRRWEERLIALAQDGESFGHYHVYVGQEAIGIPVLAALRPDDLVFTTHRNHGHLLGRGADPGRLLAEVLGRATGLNGGKGGTLHACAPELGVPHTSAIVGGTVPIAAGAALAARRRGSDQVTMSFFGDGAMEEGAVFETLNLAALWQLPVIFLCENNTTEALGAAAGGYPASITAASDLGEIASSVGVPAVAVDGTDSGAVFAVARDAVARARAGEGPTFVNAIVARWPGSNPLWPELPAGETELRFAWAPDGAPAELSRWYREQDGVLRYARELLDAGVADRDELESIDAAVREVVRESVRFALESPHPEPAAAFSEVFATPRAPAVTDAATADAGGRELTYAEALVEALEELMAEDEELLVIGSYVLGIGPWRRHFDRIRAVYPDRVLDPPTAELAFCGVGIGAAMTHLPTMVDIGTASFVFQALPQVANEAANAISMSGGRLRLPLVFHFMHGLRGGGGAQHSHSPQAMLWNTPGLQIMLPSSPRDVKGLLRTAFAVDSPTVFADHSKLMSLSGPVPDHAYAIPFGLADVKRAGSDVTIVATSYAVHHALAAAEQLSGEGVDAEVIDPRTIVPLDRATILDSVARTGRLVVVDEGHLSCGVASEIAAIVAEHAFDALRAPIRRVAVPDVPIPFSPVLERELEPSPERIAEAVRALLGTAAARAPA
jgi:2-oxoisovalerate dehydrogenase E1 component